MEKGNKFEIYLKKDWAKKGDILTGSYNGIKIKILSLPKIHYNKWYWKVLNFITFGRYFNVKYTYTAKLI